MSDQKATDSRWQGVERPYTAADVARLSGSVKIEYSLARLGAEKFWRLLHSEPVVAGLGSMTGNQAVQAVQAGLKAIYCSGWQVAGDGNSALRTLDDASKPIDVILLDYRLPDSDSLTLLSTIRRIAPTSQVIMMTAYGTPDVTRGALALGAWRVMSKPFEMREMAADVQRASRSHPPNRPTMNDVR